MKLEQTFEVTAPVERVWEALIDVERVAPCLPGAAVTGKNDDGSYNGTFSVKIGPTSASYAGKLDMEKIDESSHTAVMRANGTDKRGQGGAKALITSVVTPLDGGRAQVEVDTDYQITGRLARFGRGGMIEDISEKLLREFANNLQASLAGGGGEAAAPAGADGDGAAPADPEPAGAAEGTEPPPVAAQPPPAPPPAGATELDAGALLASVVKERIRRNPAPLIGGLLAIVLLRRFRRRRRRA
jgi:carbon monoxide dehydrogenase subunit G